MNNGLGMIGLFKKLKTMREQILDILKDGINDIESVKKQYPKMNTQDVIDALRRLQDSINELTIPVVVWQSEQFYCANKSWCGISNGRRCYKEKCEDWSGNQ